MATLTECFQRAITDVLAQQYQDLTWVYEPSDYEALSYCQHICAIVSSGQQLTVLFKLMFAQTAADALYQKSAGETPTPAQTWDYIKESVNMMIGRFKEIMGSVEIQLGSSIPIIIPGYCETFFATEKGPFAEQIYSRCHSEAAEIFISTYVTFPNTEAQSKIKSIVIPDARAGQLEFL